MKSNAKTTILAIVLPCAVSWFLFHSVLTGTASTWLGKHRFAGGKEGAIEQTQAALAAYRNSNWNWDAVPADLKELTDVAIAKQTLPKNTPLRSFVIGGFPTEDEIAFYSVFYVKRKLTVIKGIEGKTTTSGFYIVAYRNGIVTAVPADQARILWFRGPKEVFGLNVFPGMRDYGRSYPLGTNPPDDLIPDAPARLMRLGAG